MAVGLSIGQYLIDQTALKQIQSEDCEPIFNAAWAEQVIIQYFLKSGADRGVVVRS